MTDDVATAPAPTGFHIMMPPGWSRYLVDDEGKRALIAQISRRMRELSRPDLDAEARTLVEVQWRKLRSARITAIYLPGEGDEVLPTASIAVRQHAAPAGTDFAQSLRAVTSAPIETFDTPIGTVLRWVEETRGEGEIAEIRSRQIGYGFPLPGAGERRGLVFLAATPYLDDSSEDMVDALTERVDTIMETFRWR
ncbi:hypothetical protein [Microbacterium sp. Marseille-Q6648]|jgi:hypothetical protein|uniref:hypothetical protein n=1 Tax=Microbacterium sp. Marseille-Q6648 TaxID=2937991 RepID=UPI00203A4881|nr:hypothetical protein [Microbacterium sp. Marseille-Q6648]